MVVNFKFKIPNARDLFKSFKMARSEWKLKTPMQKWCYLYGFGRLSFYVVRQSVLNDINRVHWFAIFTIGLNSSVVLMSLYTMFYYAIHGHIERGLPSTCLATIFLAHLPIMLNLVNQNRFRLQSLIDFGGRYIYHDTHERTDYNRICGEDMDETMKQFIIKMSCKYASYMLAVIGPAYAYIKHGVRSTFVELRIPFTEPKSDAEFAGNFILQSVIGAQGMIGYIGFECFLALLENVVTITPQLIESDLEHAIRFYEEKSISELQLHVKFVNIVKQCIDADNYIEAISNVFYWNNLFIPTAFSYSIGIAIFSQYTIAFAAGYGLAGMIWSELFFACELGENIQDNGFTEMLYQIKWELLPLSVQRTFVPLIRRKQNEKGLRLGPFGMGINRETFKLLTNRIYTFVMFLVSFFE